MVNLYITQDKIGANTGGGAVTFQESLALEELEGKDSVIRLGRDQVDPSEYCLGSDPFSFDSAMAQEVERLLKIHKVRIAHFYAGSFPQTVRLLKQTGVFVTYTVAPHDPYVSREEFARCHMEYPFKHLVKPKAWELYLKGYREADIVVTPSLKGAELMASFGCKKFMVIPHGHEPAKEFSRTYTDYNVGYLGQAGPDKGVMYLLRAWKRLNYSDATLYIAGKWTEGLFEYARELGGGKIVILGFVDDINEFFSKIKIYVQPSVTEGFGIEVLEAMDRICIPIVSQGAGANEIIKDGEDGFVVPIRSPKAIADKIDWLRSNRKQAEHMSVNAVQKAKNYTWGTIRGLYKKTWEKHANAAV